MKVLTKEEEDAHYNAVLRGGLGGGVAGLAIGLGLVYTAHRRLPFFRSLTLPLKAFFVTSTGTFASIITADRYSRTFEVARHVGADYEDATAKARKQAIARETTYERMMSWGRDNRYKIVTASWAASMGASLGLVWQDKYLTRAQKLVQARVYAQGLTLLVLIASAAFEVSNNKSGNQDTYKVLDPMDPQHKRMIEKRVHHEQYQGEDLWMDMVAGEEKKMKERKEREEERRKEKESAQAK